MCTWSNFMSNSKAQDCNKNKSGLESCPTDSCIFFPSHPRFSVKKLSRIISWNSKLSVIVPVTIYRQAVPSYRAVPSLSLWKHPPVREHGQKMFQDDTISVAALRPHSGRVQIWARKPLWTATPVQWWLLRGCLCGLHFLSWSHLFSRELQLEPRFFFSSHFGNCHH